MVDLDRLINSEDRLNKYLDYLIEILASDYHYSFKDLIAKRLKDVVYIFDSFPSDSYEVLKRLGFNAKEKKDLFNYYLEHKDYLDNERIIDKVINKKRDNYLKDAFNISSSFYKKNRKIINSLDYKYFSSFYDEYYDRSDISKVIDNYRRNYIKTCKKIGLSPLVDQKKIDLLIESCNYLNDFKNYKLLNSTLFGKRMKEKIGLKLQVNSSLQNKYLRNLLDIEEHTLAFTTCIKNKTVIYFPILANYQESLDVVLLHEMIHALERVNNNYGLDIVNLEQTTFNELRTQKKALEISKKLRKDHVYIFDMDDRNTKSNITYDKFIPLVSNFLEENKQLLDYAALTNRMSILYKMFSKDDFELYTYILENMYYLYQVNGYQNISSIIKDNKNEICELEKRMVLTKASAKNIIKIF